MCLSPLISKHGLKGGGTTRAFHLSAISFDVAFDVVLTGGQSVVQGIIYTSY